ncbi:VC0807 family protein [Hamadaea tsunoensis]|uniref:VC0807 family protein n=1 Tax=Hamadaea tsunoensis TaxID=53368 RepID=UPI0004117D85|nr:VC0807 family protein [Hamadaea tsunoensis]
MKAPVSRRALAGSVLLDLVAPLAVYYGARALGVGQWAALAASAVIPLGVVVYRFVQRRQIEYFALFIVTAVALGLVLSALTGDPRTILVREAWTGMLGGLAGLWLLGSLLRGRPALMVLFRSFVLAKSGPEGLRTWAARWDDEPRFRHGLRVLTAVWGVAFLLSAVLQLLFAYALPLDVAPAAMNGAWPVIAVPLFVFHLTYTKRHSLRA